MTIETGQALLQDLLEISLAPLKGGKEKTGSAAESMTDVLGGEECFMSTLIGLAVDKDFDNSGSPTLVNTFLPETKIEKFSAMALVGFFEDNTPLFIDAALQKNSHGLPFRIEGIVEDAVFFNESPSSSKTILESAEIENANEKFEGLECIELLPESGSEKSTADNGEPEIKDYKTTTDITGPDMGEANPGEENTKMILPDKDFGIEKSERPGVISSGSEIQKGALIQPVLETEPPKLHNVIQKNIDPGNRNTSNENDANSEQDTPRNLHIHKQTSPDSLTLEKALQHTGMETKTSKHSFETQDKKIPLNSQSISEQQGEETIKSEAGLKRTSAISNSKSDEVVSSSAIRGPQVTETTTDNMKISGEGIPDLQKEKLNSLARGNPTPNISPYPGPKYQNSGTAAAKTEALTQQIIEGRIIKLDTENGEAAFLASNHQFSDKNFESLLQAKEPSTAQRPFQTEVLSQLVEKAVMSLKNGQTSIILKLKPESLGRLRMEIMTKDNQVMIKIHTEMPLVKDIIESNVNHLRSELQNQGLEIEKFDVSVDHGSNKGGGEASELPFRKMRGESGDAKTEEGPVVEINKTAPNTEEGESGIHINFFA